MNDEHVDIKTPEYVSLQFQTAGLGSRAAAFLIDQLLLIVINITIVIILAASLNLQPDDPFAGPAFGSAPLAIAVIALFVINWGYFFVYEFFSGGKTLGKKLIGIRVIQENGQSITLLASFIRNLVRIIDMLPAYYFVGMLMVFFHKKHKRLGDITAGTIVVHERGKKGKRKTSVEKEIAARGLNKESMPIEEEDLKPLGTKEWKLLRTYTQRFPDLQEDQRNIMTRQIAEIILPKASIDQDGKTFEQLENTLLVIYLNLKDEWEYEL